MQITLKMLFSMVTYDHLSKSSRHKNIVQKFLREETSKKLRQHKILICLRIYSIYDGQWGSIGGSAFPTVLFEWRRLHCAFFFFFKPRAKFYSTVNSVFTSALKFLAWKGNGSSRSSSILCKVICFLRFWKRDRRGNR